MKNSKRYLEAVDGILKKIRSKFLGQDLPLEHLLPAESGGWESEEKVLYLTKSLLFSLVRAEPELANNVELRAASEWFYAMILLLMTRCRSEDRTFSSIKNLLELDEGTRKILLEDMSIPEPKTSPSFLLNSFDLMLLDLFETRRLNESWQKNLRALIACLQS